jgi:tellurite resistance protein TerC
MTPELLPWIGFGVFVAVMLALDLGVFHRHSHEVRVHEALIWTGVWISLALLFNAWVWYFRGTEAGMQFLAGYLVELSLSVDNLFVFLLLFGYFRVPAQYQHNVLFWGILGALVMRAIFVAMGISLIQHFHWVIYIFGGFLIITGIRIALDKDHEIHPERNPMLKIVRKLMPVTNDYVGSRFFVRQDGRLHATPLFVVLSLVESADVVFAVDSVPAVLAITTDPFIVYTSNVFAILGLRSMFFALSGVLKLFRFLNYGLAAVLVFVGCKMTFSDFVKLPTWVSLTVIVVLLGLAVVASVIWKGDPPIDPPPIDPPPAA